MSNIIPFPKKKLEEGEDNELSRFLEKYAARARRGEFLFVAIAAGNTSGDSVSAWEVDPKAKVPNSSVLAASAFLQARLYAGVVDSTDDD